MRNIFNKAKNTGTKFMNGVKAFWQDENGMGTVEVILIIVVLIGLVIVFKKQINTIVDDIFKAIREETREITN